MSEKTSFRIDVILQSVNELRQEKRALEQRYAEETNRNKSLEIKLEQDTFKLNQSKERNIKMQETVKVAEQKVSQTKDQADRLTEINDVKQKVIEDLNYKIKQEVQKQDQDVGNFELKLLELTDLFRNAKQLYGKDALSKEIMGWKESIEALVVEADKKKVDLGDVTKAFENLLVDTDKVKELVGKKIGHEGLTYKDLYLAIDFLTRKQKQMNMLLEWIENCCNTTNTWAQKIKRRQPMIEEQHIEFEEGYMEFTQGVSDEERYEYCAQDLQPDTPSYPSYYYTEPVNHTSNETVSSHHQPLMMQSPFFISLPFTGSR